jgi:hypothetical protein
MNRMLHDVTRGRRHRRMHGGRGGVSVMPIMIVILGSHGLR